MKIEIKHRWSGKIIFSVAADDMKSAIKFALKQKTDLRDADLRCAVLRCADLSYADLRDAVLRCADLSYADLRDADLRGADLSGADLSGAVLRCADLSGAVLRCAVLSYAVLRYADLRGADLSGAVLRCAVLRDAVLRYADLRDADLTSIRDDFWSVLMLAPAEVAGLRQSIIDGKIDGSTYVGDCACLVGTIANIRKCDYESDSMGILKPDSTRPIERFFTGIKPGDTPEKSQFAKIAQEWLDQWIELQQPAAKVFGTEQAK